MIPLRFQSEYGAVVLGDGPFALKAMDFFIQVGIAVRLFVPRSSGVDQALKAFCSDKAIKLAEHTKAETDDLYNEMKSLEPDFLICASFDRILPRRLIELPKVAALNIHAAPLPRYRGGSPLNWQLIAGENHIVLTIHYMKIKVDSGNILAQIHIPLSSDDNYSSVIEKTSNTVPEAMLIAVTKAIAGDPGRPMDPNKGFYLPRRKPGDEFLDWNWSAQTIFDFVRALAHPGPFASTFYNDKILSFGNASLEYKESFVGIPGTVLALSRNEGWIVVKCADSAIKLGNILPQELFEQIKVGDRLGVNLNLLWKKLLERKS